MEEENLPDTALVANRQSNMAGGEKAESPLSSPNQEMSSDMYEYVTGFKLAIVIASVTMVFFLVMLDLSIIATVSQASVCQLFWPQLTTSAGHSSYYKRLPFFA